MGCTDGGLEGARCAGWRPLPAAGEARDLPVPVGSALPDRSLRLQAAACRVARRGTASVGARRSACHRHDRESGRVPDHGIDVRVRAARRERRLGQRVDAQHGPDCRQALLPQGGEHGGDQPRPGHHVPADRASAAGPSQLRRLAELRHRLGEPGPAGLHRADLPGQCEARVAGPVPAPLGLGFPALRAPGCQSARGRGSRALPVRSTRDRPGRTPPDAGRGGAAQRGAPRRVRRPGDRGAHRAVRDGLPDAGFGP